MVGRFVEASRRRGLKVNAGKSKVMVLGVEYRLKCKVYVDGICLEHISEFKYLGCVLGESVTDKAECRKKMASWRREKGAIRFLVDANELQLEWARV